ncbi:MAG: M15 family metallopeptidase [Christensenellaceae bacterium]|nr:M15 family metallopeptidase [Christensenellaceae bacterium]
MTQRSRQPLPKAAAADLRTHRSRSRYSQRQKRRSNLLVLTAFFAVCTLCLLSLYFLADAARARQEQQLLPSPTPSPRQETTVIDQQKQPSILVVNFTSPLPDGYRPERLTSVNAYLGDIAVCAHDDLLAHPDCLAAARAMLEAARRDGVPTYVINSAYRSIEEQNILFTHRLESDPTYASDPYNNPVKCMPSNCSEHSTGLALDILNTTYNVADAGYGQSAGGSWLAENAHKYGFILRYPQNKEHVTGVIYEPWHVRYVGIEAATKMHKSGLCLEEFVARG